MKVFTIKHDIENYKFYLQNEHDSLSLKAFSYEGSSLVKNWAPFRVSLFKGKTKAEKLLREDFNASCFDDGLLYVMGDISEALCKSSDSFERLNIITDDERVFYYMNLTKVVSSLVYSDISEIQRMHRNGVYDFNKEVIKNESIFRDGILPSNYFLTERFLDGLKCDIKGVFFKEVGEV